MNRFENRLNTNLKKWHILNPVWDNEKEDALNVFKMIDLLNELSSENKKLEKENLDLSEELDYYKTKCTSLETGYIQEQDENWRLEKSKMEFANELGKTIDENEQLKSEINGMEELLKSYRKTIKHDAELLADATKNGYLPPLKEWKEV